MSGRASSGFEKLNRSVQKWIWDKGWTELRDIQEEAVAPILSGRNDLIIASATASGKTEAAYLPICSYVADKPASGIRVLYISPLKALINDQYWRLEELCEYCRIPVHKWHGDVGAGKKKKLLDKPSGMLLITPESLEAIFVIHGHKLKKLFGELSFVIIDELHAFLDNERGKQLQSLLCRLELVVKKKIPRIGLSATIGDMSVACEFLRREDSIRVVTSKKGDRELRLQIRGYKIAAPSAEIQTPAPQPSAPQTPEAQMPVTQAPTTTGQIAGHLFKVLRGNDNLVFANSRANVETYTDRLSRLSESRNCPNEFFPHHGSLSRAIRTSVEKRLKEGKLPTSAVCTSTLEMGIDIGSVKSIAQVGCPFSISSLRQRLGRSGRKDGDPSILRIYIEEEEVTQRTHHEDMLRGCLFQSAAMTELLIRKWLEPPDGNILHLSTLVQQLLSLIAQYGGIKAQNAWKALCLLGPFNRIDEDAFVLFLRNLGKRELLSQTHDGDLVLGHIGERIVNHYSFYSAFVTEEEYRLIANGKTLGTMPISNPIFIGAYLIFAGKRWEITKVDDEQKVILLRPSRGGKPPGFSSSGGQVHDEIRKEMLRLYQSDNVPVYLDKEAAALFREGRDNFMRLQLNHRRIVPAGEDTIIFPWVGDKVLNTLHLLFKNQEIKTERHDFSLTVEGRTPDEVIALLEDIFKAGPVYPLHLASIVDAKKREKYDHYLPDALLCAEYASRFIDINGALECIESLIK